MTNYILFNILKPNAKAIRQIIVNSIIVNIAIGFFFIKYLGTYLLGTISAFENSRKI